MTLTVSEKDNKIVFAVHNTEVIPEENRSKIFQFGLSTKGEGRGIGTYSMKLFGENYLKGKVWFSSAPGEGTTFFLAIPKGSSKDMSDD